MSKKKITIPRHYEDKHGIGIYKDCNLTLETLRLQVADAIEKYGATAEFWLDVDSYIVGGYDGDWTEITVNPLVTIPEREESDKEFKARQKAIEEWEAEAPKRKAKADKARRTRLKKQQEQKARRTRLKKQQEQIARRTRLKKQQEQKAKQEAEERALLAELKSKYEG